MNDVGEIILTPRTDDDTCYVLGGIVEFGETPSDAIANETLEETGNFNRFTIFRRY